MRMFSFSLSIVALWMAIATACGPSAPSAAGPPSKEAPAKIEVGMNSKSVNFWPLFVADHKGFFQQENLQVELTVAGNVSQITTALLTGSLDIAATNASSVISKARNEAVIVGGITNKVVYSLIVRPEISSYQDLKGKKLGIASQTDAGTIFLTKLFAQKGLNKDDIDFITLGANPERLAGLNGGAIDAAILNPPGDFQAMDMGFKRLNSLSDLAQDYAFVHIIVRRDWVKANEDKLVRFLRAMVKGEQWLANPANKKEAVDLYVKETKDKEDIAAKSYDLFVTETKAIVTDGSIPSAALQALMDGMEKIGTLSRPFPPESEVADFSYLKKATAK